MSKQNIFIKALKRENEDRPPVWLMRQAGRYHSHYQKLKERHTFMELCKDPVLAEKVTLGPIEDFDFDAAILFSDLLFPLEAMGMGLEYDPGPKLNWHLQTVEDLKKLEIPKIKNGSKAHFMEFQGEALRRLRKSLSQDKGLIGFVGGPWTLFCYAVDGSHAGGLFSSKEGLKDGRYEGFLEALLDMLADNMILQATAGADGVAVLDTCAGEVNVQDYEKYIVPGLKGLMERFKKTCPDTPVVYYSKKTTAPYWQTLKELNISCLGVDWNMPLKDVISGFGSRYSIQGNIDPDWLHLEKATMEDKIRAVFESVKNLDLRGYVCGLGHGVLQRTPEESVRRFVTLSREVFSR